MADALVEYETLDIHQIDDVMNNISPRKPADWGNHHSKPDPSDDAEDSKRYSDGSEGGAKLH